MNSGKGMNPHRSWVYHPLEFGVTGSKGREGFVQRLAQALGAGTGVLDGRTTEDADDGAWSVLNFASVLVEEPLAGRILPRLHLVVPRAPRTVVPAGREPPPVVVAGPGSQPRLPWGVPWFDRDDIEGLAGFVRGYWDSQVASRPLLGLVLAGGRSGLMGIDKAQLRYGGKNQIERTFDLVSRFCQQTWVSCRKDQSASEARTGWPQVHDRYLDRGPLGGILSALDHRPDAAWLVVACDHPYLDEATLRELLDRRDPWGFATSFRGTDGLPEPLCAVYEPKSRLGLLRTWALGYPCPRKLLAGPASLVLNPSRPETLIDVNTPREGEAARRLLGS